MNELAEKSVYDGLLLNILEREGKIDNFIGVIFGFLLRNTDFFRIMPDPTAKLGFPPGVARTKVFEAFQACEERSFHLFPREKELVRDAIQTAQANKTRVPAQVAAPSPSFGISDHNQSMPTSSSSVTVAPSSVNSASSAEDVPVKGGARNVANDTENTVSSSSPPPLPSVVREEEVPPSEFQDNPDTYNGAARDNYSWGQTIKDLDLRIKVHPSIKKGKSVRVAIKDDRIKVEVESDGRFETLIDSELKWKIHPTNSFWALIPGDHVHINLEKIQERWWDACFVNEPEIELKSIDCSRPLEDLDDESLATVNKLQFDQMQKEMGKPTSDQLRVMDQLKSGWNAEGSPFKGQPFDPSVLNIGGS